MNLRASLAVMLAVLLLAPATVAPVTAASEGQPQETVSYTFTYDAKTGTTTVVTEITTAEPEEYSRWTVSWKIPEDANIKYVRSTQGEASYERNGGDIKLKEYDGEPRKAETFTIKYTTQSTSSQSVVSSIRNLQFSLVSFSEAPTTAELTIKNGRLLNTIPYQGKITGINDSTVQLSGKGPFTFSTNIHPSGTPSANKRTEHYSVYNAEGMDLSGIDKAYDIAYEVTGEKAQYNHMPVAYLPKETYEQNFGGDSFGVFSSRGIIYLKKDVGDNELAVLAHETVHAFNQRLLGDVPTWFDEGTAQIAEDIARDYRETPHAEFHEDDKLKEYNSQRKTWVFDTKWNASTSFGYDYAEMRINLYMKDNGGLQTLHNSYDQLVASNQTKYTTSEISKIGGISPTPTWVCDDVPNPGDCADELVTYVPPYNIQDVDDSSPSVTTPTDDSTTTTPTDTQTTTPTDTKTTDTTTTDTTTTDTTTTDTPTDTKPTSNDDKSDGIVKKILDILRWVFNWLIDLLANIT